MPAASDGRLGFERPRVLPADPDEVRTTVVSSTRDAKTSHESSSKNSQRSLLLAVAAAQVAEDNRGQDIVVLDLRGLTSVFDFFVIASGTSRRQLHAIADEIDDKLCKELNDQRLGIEGYQGSSWILLDYGSIVIHLFEQESRDFYGIEKLWGEAKVLPWKDHTGLLQSATSPASPAGDDSP